MKRWQETIFGLESKNFEIVKNCSRPNETSFAWFNTLTDDQLDELVGVELGVNGTEIGIVKDWIEDHGGDRDWFYSYYINAKIPR